MRPGKRPDRIELPRDAGCTKALIATTQLTRRVDRSIPEEMRHEGPCTAAIRSSYALDLLCGRQLCEQRIALPRGLQRRLPGTGELEVLARRPQCRIRDGLAFPPGLN